MTQPRLQFIFANAAQFKTSTTGFCTPDIKLLDAGTDGVTLTSPDAPNPDGSYPSAHAHLNVPKGKTPKLKFTVVDAAGSNTAYALGGVALKKSALALRAAAHCEAFPRIEIDFDHHSCASELTLHVDNASGTGSTYDFWVLVQDSNGDAGLIDPKIVNEP